MSLSRQAQALANILNSLPDRQLAVAVMEIKRLNKTSVLRPNGIVNKLIHRVVKEIGIREFDARRVVESHVIHSAAYRWAADNK